MKSSCKIFWLRPLSNMPCSYCGRWEDDWIDWQWSACQCAQTAMTHISMRHRHAPFWLKAMLAQKSFFVCKSCKFSSFTWNVRKYPHITSKNSVTILCRWGTHSWLVCFGGKYYNKRPPHVATNVRFVGGETFELDVPTLKQNHYKNQTMFVITRTLLGFSDRYGDDAHITVYHSMNKPDLAAWEND